MELEFRVFLWGGGGGGGGVPRKNSREAWKRRNTNLKLPQLSIQTQTIYDHRTADPPFLP